MATSRKLHTAHFLMFIGVAPLMAAVAIALAGIVMAQRNPGQAGASDAFLMIALLGLGYASSVIVGGAGALWSWFLTARGVDQRTMTTRVLRVVVIAALVAPPVWCLTLLI